MEALGIEREDAKIAELAVGALRIKYEASTLESELWDADVGDKYQINIGGVIADAEVVEIKKKKWRSGCNLIVHFDATCAPGQVATPVA